MDPYSMIVAIVLITTFASVARSYFARGGSSASGATQRQLLQQQATIEELRKRVEHLEIIVTDPDMLATLNVRKALNTSTGTPSTTSLPQTRAENL